MAQKRVGCYACFQTLDPKDKILRLRAVIKCETCGALYHAACREDSEVCYRCATQKFHAVRIARPSRLVITARPYTQEIKPSTVIVLDKGQSKGKAKTSNRIVDIIVYSVQSLWAIMLAWIMVALAIGIGIYVYRILQLPFLSIKTIMDAIIRVDPPSFFIMMGAIGSGLIFGFVCYSRVLASGRRFTYLLAGVISLVCFNFWLLNIDPRRILFTGPEIFYGYIEFFYAQGSTAIAVFLLIPLYRALAPLRVLPEHTFPAWLQNIYGWIRLLIASVLVGLAAVYFATHWLSTDQQPKVSDFYQFKLPNNLTEVSIITASAIASALIIAAVFYWPPQFREVQWRLGFIRLLLVITGIITIGLLYRTPINPQPILNTLQLTSVIMMLGIPIQRALS